MVLGVLIKREIKAFMKNPTFIATLVILIVFYASIGGITRRGIEEVGRIVLEADVGIVLEDRSPLVMKLVDLLNTTLAERIGLCESLEKCTIERDLVVIIPEKFTDNVTRGVDVLEIKGFFRVNSTSSTMIRAQRTLLSQVSLVIGELLPVAVSEVYNYTLPRRPVINTQSNAYIAGRQVDIGILDSFLTVASILPLLTAIVIGSNAGYAAQLVAYEKVEKAFEMLLAQPIKRSRIVIAKLIGASVATILFSLIYISGLLLFIIGLSPGEIGGIGQGNVENPLSMLSSQLGVDMVSHTLISLAISIVLGLLISGSLGIVIGSLVVDERSAGILITPITLVFIGIAYIPLSMGIQLDLLSSVISGIFVALLPVTYILSVIFGEVTYLAISISISITTCIFLIALAIYLFNRDIVILGLRISFRRT